MPSRALLLNLQSGDDYKNSSDVNNEVTVRSVYGNATGSTLGQVASAMSAASLGGTYSQSPTSADVPTQGAAAPSGGPMGSPVVWLVILALLLVGFRFLAGKGGEGAQFANLKVTIWNVVLISLVAIVGIVFFKIVFSKVNVPGLSPLVQAV